MYQLVPCKKSAHPWGGNPGHPHPVAGVLLSVTFTATCKLQEGSRK